MRFRGVIGAVLAASVVAASDIRFPEDASPLGLARQKLMLGYNRLCAPPLNDEVFVLSDVDFTLKRRFTEYSGDISGRMLGALGLAAYVLDRETPMLGALVKALPEKQQADGHFGAPQDLAAAITQERDMPILWGNGRLLRAMAEQCRRTDDPALRAAAIRLGDYVIATRPYYGKKENFEAVGGLFASGFTTCYPSLIDGLVQLGVTTGEERFFEEARFIATLSLADTEFEKRHSHGRLTAYRGMLELDLAKGARDFVDAVEQGVRQIAEKYPFSTGGIPELFDLAYERDEGCSEADWVWVHLLLWQATRKPNYLDVAENVVRNHIYPTQFANGGFGHYRFTNLKHGDSELRGGGIANAASDSYWCCSMHATQLLADLPAWGAFVDAETIRVTWLAEVKSTLWVKDTRVGVTLEESEPGRWTVQLAPEKAVDATLALRVPAWAQVLRVDGEERPGQEGWLLLNQKLNAPATITVELPIALRMQAVSEDGPALIYSGADLMCLPDMGLRREFLQPGTAQSLTVCPERIADAHMPALVRDAEGRHQQTLLGPMAQRLSGGCRYGFDVTTAPADEFDQLWVEAMPPEHPAAVIRAQFAVDSTYDVYLNGAHVLRHSGWQESPTLELNVPQGENFIAVALPAVTKISGLIGCIRPGGAAIVTEPSEWKVYVFHGEPAAADVAAAALTVRQPEAIKDFGAFGVSPWEHIPGHFASTDARWIWAEPTELPEGSWLVFARAIAVEDAE